MAVAELRSAERSTSVPLGAGAALAGAMLGGASWYAGVALLYDSRFAPFLGVLGTLVGVFGGYGALAAGRERGWRVQAATVAATLVGFLIAEFLVVQLELTRQYAELGITEIEFNAPFWEYLSWGLFGSNPPTVIFLIIALGYAISIPRRYPDL